MGKEEGSDRDAIMKKMRGETYLEKSAKTVQQMKNDPVYNSEYGVRAIGKNGGYVAVTADRKTEPLVDANGELTNFGKEIFASEAMARDGWRIILKNDYASAEKGSMPDGTANMNIYEIKSPSPEKSTSRRMNRLEANINNTLKKAWKDGKTEIVTLYMGENTVGQIHREHIHKAIQLFNDNNKHRYKHIVVVDVKGNTYYWNHN